MALVTISAAPRRAIVTASSNDNGTFNLKRASKDLNKMRKSSDKKVKKLKTEVADDISKFIKSDRVRRETRNEELKNILEALDRFVKEEIGEVGSMLGNNDKNEDLDVTFDSTLDLEFENEADDDA